MAEFRVFRFNPDRNVTPYYDKFHISIKKHMTVLDGLLQIQARFDPSLAFRHSCKSGQCGSCALNINGQYRLACKTLITSLESWEIEINPLGHLPIIRDLVVDMKPFFDNYRKAISYLKSGEAIPAQEFEQSIAHREKLAPFTDCVMCGACYASCPVTATHAEYFGPHSLLKNYRFIVDNRDAATEERLDLVSGSDGVFRCHNVYNCQIACPKGIDPSLAISKTRKMIVKSKIKTLLQKR